MGISILWINNIVFFRSSHCRLDLGFFGKGAKGTPNEPQSKYTIDYRKNPSLDLDLHVSLSLVWFAAEWRWSLKKLRLVLVCGLFMFLTHSQLNLLSLANTSGGPLQACSHGFPASDACRLDAFRRFYSERNAEEMPLNYGCPINGVLFKEFRGELALLALAEWACKISVSRFEVACCFRMMHGLGWGLS